jgi:glycerate kinase
MKLLFAPDSFGGTWSASEVAERFEASMARHGAFVDTHPMSDGGEGLLDALMSHGTIELHGFEVNGPEEQSVFASAGRRNGAWWIESAEAIGLQHCTDPYSTQQRSSGGLGELIRRTSLRHRSPTVIGLGGSGTVDGGVGMLLALGVVATDDLGRIVYDGEPNGSIHRIRRLHGKINPEMGLLKVLCDVQTTIENAACVFGPQKGMTPEEIPAMTDALRRWTDVLNDWRIEHNQPPIHPLMPGGGAAGGLGFALAAMGGVLAEGGPQMARVTGLKTAIQESDAVIIGEGHLDASSMEGKATGTVLGLAAGMDKPVYALVGRATHDCGIEPGRISEINGTSPDQFDAAVDRLWAAIESIE